VITGDSKGFGDWGTPKNAKNLVSGASGHLWTTISRRIQVKVIFSAALSLDRVAGNRRQLRPPSSKRRDAKSTEFVFRSAGARELRVLGGFYVTGVGIYDEDEMSTKSYGEPGVPLHAPHAIGSVGRCANT
jgi:hypothetical protein